MAETRRGIDVNITDFFPKNYVSPYREERETRKREAQEQGVPERKLDVTVPIDRIGGSADFGDNFVADTAEAVVDFSVGLKSGATGVVAWLPDAGINLLAKGLVASGLIDEENVNKDYINRFINAADYETMQKIDGVLGNVLGALGIGLGKGEKIGQTTRTGRIGETTGEFAAFALPYAGVVRGIGSRLYGGVAGSKNAVRKEAVTAIQKAEKQAIANVGSQAEKVAIKKKFKAEREKINSALKEFKWNKKQKAWVGPEGAVTRSKVDAKLLGRREAVAKVTGKEPSPGFIRDFISKEAQLLSRDPKRFLRNEAGIGAAIGAGFQTAEEVFGEGSGNYIIGAGLAFASIPVLTSLYKQVSPAGRMFSYGEKIIREKPEGYIAKGVSKASEIKESYLPGKPPTASELNEAKGLVQENVQKSLSTKEAQENMKNFERINKILLREGFEPMDLTIGEQAMSIPMLQQQARLAKGFKGERAVEELNRLTANMEKIDLIAQKYGLEDIAELQVKKLDTPIKFFDDTGKFIKTEAETLETAARNIKTDAQQIQSAIENIPVTNIGQSFRATIANRKEAAMKAAERKAAQEGINTRQTVVTPQVLAKEQEKFLRSYLGDKTTDFEILKTNFLGKTEQLTEAPKLIQNFIKFDPRRGFEFKDWRGQKEEVANQVSRLFSSGRTREAKDLQKFQTYLNTLENKFGTKGVSQTPKKYLDYLKWYDENVIQPFASEPVIKMLVQTGDSRTKNVIYKTIDDEIGNLFLKNENSANSFNRLFGNDIDSLEQMKSIVLSDFLQKGKNKIISDTGTINQELLRKYIAGKKGVLETIKVGENQTALDLLQNQQNILKNLADEQLKIQRRVEAINEDVLYSTIRKIEFKNKEVEGTTLTGLSRKTGRIVNEDEIIDQAIRNAVDEKIPNVSLLKRLKQEVVKVDKKQGLSGSLEKTFNKEIFRRLAARGETPAGIFKDPETTGIFLARNEKILEATMGKEHFENLLVLNSLYARLAKQAQVVPQADSLLVADNFLDSLIRMGGITPQGLAARSIAVIEKRSGLPTAGAWVATQALRARSNKALNQAFEESLFNRKFAEAMTKELPPNVPMGSLDEKTARSLRYQFLIAGIYDPSVISGEDKFVPIKPKPETQVKVQPETKPVPVPPSLNYLNSAGYGVPTTSTPLPTKPTSAPSFENLFPNDPLGQVIAERKKGGIGSLP